MGLRIFAAILRAQHQAVQKIPMRKQILTINVEDYFHVWAIRNSDAVRRKHWDRLDPRLSSSLGTLLSLLREHEAKATFFVFGCIADSDPDVVGQIMADGHEVASRGYWPRSLQGLSSQEFMDDLGRTKLALERAGANPILGYRSPVWLADRDLWLLDSLASAGYVYDASINPFWRRFASHSEYRSIQQVSAGNGRIWEFPITTASVAGVRIAISGGNYVRQFPHSLLSAAVARRVEEGSEPVVFYFMPWELDPGQPQIAGLSFLSRVRQYRGLAKTRWVVEHYLNKYSFHGIADELKLAHAAIPEKDRPPRVPEVVTAPSVQTPDNRPEATLVIPLYNEEQNVRYLHRSLSGFRARLAERYRLHLLLVDDCSTDNTWQLLGEIFGPEPDTKLIRHERNRGVAAALLTGLRAAPSEIVCSLDCDCSYDPEDIAGMLPLIENADLVTASPYHPQGSVLHVPPWRLFLSKSLSRMYSVVLKDRAYTYTSCCRVYRKSKFADIELSNEGFLGVAETLIECKRRGGRVVEYPATLESRLLGESKMKIARTITRHLGLLSTLAVNRAQGTLFHSPPASGSPDPQDTPPRSSP
jgi:polysaccharide deacetylase family protein (PEP-CTERM system associated)